MAIDTSFLYCSSRALCFFFEQDDSRIVDDKSGHETWTHEWLPRPSDPPPAGFFKKFKQETIDIIELRQFVRQIPCLMSFSNEHLDLISAKLKVVGEQQLTENNQITELDCIYFIKSGTQ